MKRYEIFVFPVAIAIALLSSACSMIEKASLHGFNSGYYTMNYEGKVQKVYVDMKEDSIDVYHQTGTTPYTVKFLSIPSRPADSPLKTPLVFGKQSLDIDITSVLLKYRPSVNGLPPQLTSEFNAALYAGWRHDRYKIVTETDPLGKMYNRTNRHGYDLGVFAGPGVTLISPFSTNYLSADEYSGMTIQTGIAGFLETDMASFGLVVGFDYLLNRDRDIWIYQNKPWIGFMVGIALN